MKKIIAVAPGLCIIFSVFAQEKDFDSSLNTTASTQQTVSDWNTSQAQHPLRVRSFIVPAAIILYGVGTLANNDLKEWNVKMRNNIWERRSHKMCRVDDFLQYSPALAVYTLNAMGVRGQHNFSDRTIIYGISTLITSATVCSIKKITQEPRPDNSNYNSFPSGHTATAFAAAEFLRQEYRDVSPYYGIAGYTAALATGYLRMYNDKHWFGDVVAGAGIGIISTRIAYVLYPALKRFHGRKKSDTVMTPVYEDGAWGLSIIHLIN